MRFVFESNKIIFFLFCNIYTICVSSIFHNAIKKNITVMHSFYLLQRRAEQRDKQHIRKAITQKKRKEKYKIIHLILPSFSIYLIIVSDHTSD